MKIVARTVVVVCISLAVLPVAAQDLTESVTSAAAENLVAPSGQCPKQYLGTEGPFFRYSTCDCDGPTCVPAHGLAFYYEPQEVGCNPDGTCKSDFRVVASIDFDKLKWDRDNPQTLDARWTGKPPTIKKGVDLEVPFRNYYVQDDQVRWSPMVENQYYKHFKGVDGKPQGYKDFRGILKANIDGNDTYFIAVMNHTKNYPVKIQNEVKTVHLTLYCAFQLAEKPDEIIGLSPIEAEYKNGQLTIVDERSEVLGAQFNAVLVAGE